MGPLLGTGSLYYYKSWKDTVAKGSINLLFATVRPSEDTERLNSFEIVSPDRVLCVQVRRVSIRQKSDCLPDVSVLLNASLSFVFCVLVFTFKSTV